MSSRLAASGVNTKRNRSVPASVVSEVGGGDFGALAAGTVHPRSSGPAAMSVASGRNAACLMKKPRRREDE